MATIKTFFPESNLKDFQKFVSKMQKHVDINISFGKPYSKTFTHASDNGFIKMQHQIVDMEIILPELNNWQLLASYKDGEAFIADMSKELVPSNPNHGADYRICDACKHAMRKEMYLVVNVNTGEELQVGAECAKKFGIQGLKWVSDFIKELYRVYEFNGSDISDEEPMWRGKLTDMHAVRSVSVSDAIKASKLYYDEKGGIWLKGGKVNGVYQTSESKAIISNYIDEKHFGCNDAYVEEVKAFIRSEERRGGKEW